VQQLRQHFWLRVGVTKKKPRSPQSTQR
jgi:hypothetical protein